MQQRQVGVIGLGSMGYGMAASLVKAGLDTYGFDIAAAPVERLVAEGGQKGDLADVAGTLDALVLVVVNAAQMRDVLFGKDGVAPQLKKGAVVLGCVTVAPEAARALEKDAEAAGLHYLDAPISGGPIKAAEGALTIMASGRPDAFEAARPVLDAMAETVFPLGDEAGPGSAMKIVNQLLAGVHIATAAEALTFAISQGIEPAKAVETLMQCAGASWMLGNRGQHIADGDYTPRSAVEIFVKDLGIVCDVAREARFPAYLAAQSHQHFLAATGMGLGREDDSAVAKVYARISGLTLPGDEEATS